MSFRNLTDEQFRELKQAIMIEARDYLEHVLSPKITELVRVRLEDKVHEHITEIVKIETHKFYAAKDEQLKQALIKLIQLFTEEGK